MPDLYSTLRFFTSIQFILFSFFLLGLNKGNSKSNKIFGLFLLGKGLCFLSGVLRRDFREFISAIPFPFELGVSFEFILGPMLLFYVYSLTNKKFTFDKKQIVILFPFVIHSSFIIFKFYFGNQLFGADPFYNTKTFAIIMMGLIVLHFNIYGFFSLKHLHKFKLEIKNTNSNYDVINIDWLTILLSGLMTIWFLGLINYLLIMSGIWLEFYRYFSLILTFLFSNLLIFRGLKYPEVFHSSSLEKPKYEKTLLSENEIENIITTISDKIKNKKLHLNPSLTIQQLAEESNIKSHNISQALNKKLGVNFYNFINDFRIEESKKLLSEPSENKKNISEIFYSSGFNSKATFYKVFKTKLGKTPTEFIKETLH